MLKPPNLGEAPPVREVTGLRKLVRPRLDERLAAKQRVPRRVTLSSESAPAASGTPYHGNHAEVFYFQKQIQAQTPMVFVLEGGERIEGVIEWYDSRAIKVRNHARTLIYKSSIKYIYKAGEPQG